MDELKKEIFIATTTITIIMAIQFFCTMFMLKDVKDILVNQHTELKSSTFTLKKD